MSATVSLVPKSDSALAKPRQDSQVTLFGTTDPVELIGKAGVVATALARVISERKLFVNIQGRDHVRVEGWTFLGSILGVFPVVVESREVVRDGKPCGYEAHVEARTRGGEVVGSAVARCMRSEKTWKDREDFALLSMASTRATSKAMRLPLGWVMTLAGYEATPAEEMDFAASNTASPDDIAFNDAKPLQASEVAANVRAMLKGDPKGGRGRLAAAFKASGITARSLDTMTDEEAQRLDAALIAGKPQEDAGAQG